ncbi:MAG: hypothetical protein HZB70_01970 [Candidatus Berkelbacteria bacterium]|nr:MAG: hypothetical protein HZB70_01970 [Candidatus Berkelbacteria bacterium]QQG51910.1 MAG: hypothetical protein HY845_01025 [Candidatus Berkelbacteria bacterium]
MQKFTPLGGPMLQGIEMLARQHGLRGQFSILLAVRTQEMIADHDERCSGWSVMASARKDGKILIYPWMWERFLEEDVATAVGWMANTLAEEIGHLIDYERFPAWTESLLDWRFLLIRNLRDRLGKSIPRLQPSLVKLYEWAYRRSFFEKRAKRFAEDHEEQYFAAIWPHFHYYREVYLNLSRE